MSLNDYVKSRVIGKGSYGEVWLVKHKKDRKQYVLKKLDLHNASTRERKAAEQEAKLLSKLKHPNIVSYKDSFEGGDGKLYIAMGFCEGGDLYNKLKESRGTPLEERQVVEWFVQIAMALQYIHERNILHRDLKTQNIFLTKSKIIKVGDLGIARVLEDSEDMATTLIGTPYYMSPELFSNKPYNSKSDVWALGCCVYEMTTLKHAFNAKDMNSLVYKILRGKMPVMSKIYSDELVTLIKAMLNQSPDKRPSVNRILRDPYIKKNIALFLEGTKKSRSRPSSAASRKEDSVDASSVPSGKSRREQEKKRLQAKPVVLVEEQNLEPLNIGPDLAPIMEELDVTGGSQKSSASARPPSRESYDKSQPRDSSDRKYSDSASAASNVKYGESPPKYREPSPKYGEPSPKYREPSPKYGEPSPKYREPSPKLRESPPSPKLRESPPPASRDQRQKDDEESTRALPPSPIPRLKQDSHSSPNRSKSSRPSSGRDRSDRPSSSKSHRSSEGGVRDRDRDRDREQRDRGGASRSSPSPKLIGSNRSSSGRSDRSSSRDRERVDSEDGQPREKVISRSVDSASTDPAKPRKKKKRLKERLVRNSNDRHDNNNKQDSGVDDITASVAVLKMSSSSSGASGGSSPKGPPKRAQHTPPAGSRALPPTPGSARPMPPPPVVGYSGPSKSSSSSASPTPRESSEGYVSGGADLMREELPQETPRNPPVSARERRRLQQSTENQTPRTARSVDLNPRRKPSTDPNTGQPRRRSEDYDQLRRADINNKQPPLLKPRPSSAKQQQKKGTPQPLKPPTQSAQAKAKRTPMRIVRQPSLSSSSSSENEADEAEDEPDSNKEKRRGEREMNHFISQLGATLKMEDNRSGGGKGDGEEEEEDTLVVEEPVVQPAGITYTKSSPSLAGTPLPHVDYNSHPLRHNASQPQLLQHEHMDLGGGAGGARGGGARGGMGDVTIGTTTGRLEGRIGALRKDVFRNLTTKQVMEAYTILDDVEGDLIEPRLVQLLGQEKFDLYAGKIWQLKFCEEAAWNRK